MIINLTVKRGHELSVFRLPSANGAEQIHAAIWHARWASGVSLYEFLG